MRVLVFSQYFWPESFRINDVVSSLRKEGCEVVVLTGKPNYPDGRIFDGFKVWGTQVQTHPEGYKIFRTPLLPRGRGGALRMVANYLSFVASAAWFGRGLLRGQNFDVILVYAPSPILQAIPAIALARSKRASLVTWVQDLWPESLLATGFVRNRIALKAIEHVVRWIYRRNDLLLVQAKAFLPPVRELAGSTPVVFHPNPGEVPSEAGLQGAPATLELDPGFNVVFAGNLGSVQALDSILDAASLLAVHTDIRIVLIGSGSRAEWLTQQVAERGLSNVRLPGRYPAAQMPAILAQASAMLVTLIDHPIFSMTVPSKVQTYLAAGRPVIAALRGEGAQVLEEAGAGIVCEPENPAELANAILTIRGMPKETLNALGAAGKRYFTENYSPEQLAKKLITLLHTARKSVKPYIPDDD